MTDTELDDACGPVRLSEIEASDTDRWSTGLPSLDALLGGGIVPGSAILLGGAPGMGKSTLAMQIAGASGRMVSYVSGEESKERLTDLCRRVYCDKSTHDVWIWNQTDVHTIINGYILESDADVGEDLLLIIDSLNVMHVDGLGGTPSGPLQVREACRLLRDAARERGITLLLLSHATKAGEVWGPQFLQHSVDQVLVIRRTAVEGERSIRVEKNRFGPGFQAVTLAFGEKGFQEP